MIKDIEKIILADKDNFKNVGSLEELVDLVSSEIYGSGEGVLPREYFEQIYSEWVSLDDGEQKILVNKAREKIFNISFSL